MPAIGVHFSVIFGNVGPVRAGIGLDLRVTYLVGTDGDCGAIAEGGAGLFAQATGILGDGGRLTIGAHGGVVGDWLWYGVETGFTHRFSERIPSSGFHVGMLAEGLIFDGFVRLDVSPRDGRDAIESEVGIGAHLPPIYGVSGFCSEGRPLCVDGVQQLARVVVLRRTHGPTELAPIGLSWLTAARAEAASVPAFVRLRDDLSAVGAPAALRRRAMTAARDEVRHARLCREVARSSLGLEVGLAPPPIPVTAARSRRDLLRALAIESWSEGCLGEGTAARHAQLALAGATDPAARRALTHIVRDEAAHAELAWSVLEHTLAEGGRAVRDALMHAVEQTTATPIEPDPDLDATTLRNHGRLDATTRASAQAETRAVARRRLDALT